MKIKTKTEKAQYLLFNELYFTGAALSSVGQQINNAIYRKLSPLFARYFYLCDIHNVWTRRWVTIDLL